MLRFQQAYAASAQIIAISGQMFDALINAVRR
jgi:flagellar hook-associated protein FlgK